MKKIKIENMEYREAKKLGIEDWSQWSSEVSNFDWYYEETETCYILEGEVIVTTSEERVHIREGMLVTFPKGLECVWDVRRPLRKKYIFNF